MRVELIDYMGSDLTVVNAARASFGKRIAKDTPLSEADEKLIRFLAKNRHTSPFRHCYISLGFEAPEAIARQAYKHIVGSDYAFKDSGWNEISQRYTQLSNTEMFIPLMFRKQAANNKQGSMEVAIDNSNEAYKVYLDALSDARHAYEHLLQLGVCREQARFVIPLATYTTWYWTASLQAIAHFVALRKDHNAQSEIQFLAREVNALVQPLFPISWEALTTELPV